MSEQQTPDTSSNEFYVGYLPNAPTGVHRYLVPRVLGIAAIAALLAALVVVSQQPYARATFEFGTTRSFSGIVSEFPYPALLVERPGRSASMPYSRYYLVAPGKFGMQDVLRGRHGETLQLSGTLIYRDDQMMIEVLPDTIAPLSFAGEPAIEAQDESLGNVTLRGEIVDSKCYLGVMKPATFKPHKACAIRCLSGGIPALLLVRRSDGGIDHVLLADADGRAINDRILDRVAEPVSVTGQLHRRGADLILHADPTHIVPL